MTTTNQIPQQLVPPFDRLSAIAKVRRAEDAWNSQDPQSISLSYTPDSVWRNRSEFIQGRDAIVQFLGRKWERELNYKLIKELWAWSENRIAVKFQYEYELRDGRSFRAYGNENWEFDESGLMRRREASINDVEIRPDERRFTWGKGPRPLEFPGLSELWPGQAGPTL